MSTTVSARNVVPDLRADIEEAVTLIRALINVNTDGDRAAWVAEWTTLLQDATIEDAEAALAELLQSAARIGDTISRMSRSRQEGRGERFNVRQSSLIHLLAIRKAQIKFLRGWLHEQRKVDLLASELGDRERSLALREAKLKEHAAAIEQAHKERTAALEVHKREYEQALRQRAHEQARSYMERQRAIARERIASVRERVPDASEEVLLMQAAYHLARQLKARIAALGVEEPLDPHEKLLLDAVGHWLNGSAAAQAWAQVYAAPLDQAEVP